MYSFECYVAFFQHSPTLQKIRKFQYVFLKNKREEEQTESSRELAPECVERSLTEARMT